MIQQTYLNGYYLKYEDSETGINYGLDYLRNKLQPPESVVFFNQARASGQAQFEDDYDRQFTLIYNNDGTFTLLKRDY